MHPTGIGTTHPRTRRFMRELVPESQPVFSAEHERRARRERAAFIGNLLHSAIAWAARRMRRLAGAR